MTAFMVSRINVTDEDAYKTFVATIVPIIEHHGGKVLTRRAEAILLEGDLPSMTPTTVIQFDTMEQIEAFWNSEERKAARDQLDKAGIIQGIYALPCNAEA